MLDERKQQYACSPFHYYREAMFRLGGETPAQSSRDSARCTSAGERFMPLCQGIAQGTAGTRHEHSSQTPGARLTPRACGQQDQAGSSASPRPTVPPPAWKRSSGPIPHASRCHQASCRASGPLCPNQRTVQSGQFKSTMNTGKNGSRFQGVQMGQRAAIYCRVSTSDQSCDGSVRLSFRRTGWGRVA